MNDNVVDLSTSVTMRPDYSIRFRSASGEWGVFAPDGKLLAFCNTEGGAMRLVEQYHKLALKARVTQYDNGHKAACEWSDAGCPGRAPSCPHARNSVEFSAWTKGFDEGMDDWHEAQHL